MRRFLPHSDLSESKRLVSLRCGSLRKSAERRADATASISLVPSQVGIDFPTGFAAKDPIPTVYLGGGNLCHLEWHRHSAQISDDGITDLNVAERFRFHGRSMPTTNRSVNYLAATSNNSCNSPPATGTIEMGLRAEIRTLALTGKGELYHELAKTRLYHEQSFSSNSW